MTTEGCKRRVCACVWVWWAMQLTSAAVSGTPLRPVATGYRCNHFGPAQGLPDTTINAILQTRDGYLWAATRSGLARFDGRLFRVYNRDNTPLMTNMDCTALAQDQEGDLWIGTREGVLRLRHGRFSRLGPTNGMPARSVHVLMAGRSKRLWVGLSTGLFYLKDDLTVGRFARALPRQNIWALALGRDGIVWVGGEHGLYRVQERTGNVLAGPMFPQPAWCRATAIWLDSAGEPWVLFASVHWQQLLYRFHAGKWIKCANRFFTNGGEDMPTFLAPDRQGNLWLPADGAPLIRWHAGVSEPVRLRPWTRKHDLAQCLCVDREGSLWVGSVLSGLYQLQPQAMRTYSTKDGLPDNNTWVVYPARSGGVWVGTDGGLCRMFKGRFTTYTTADGLPRDTVRAIARDSAGTLWVGTGDGLASLEYGQLRAHRFHGPLVSDDYDGIGWNKVRAILPTRDGSLWVAIPRGLHRIRGGKDRLFTTADGLSANDVRVLLEDHQGNLWCGTDGGGLDQFRNGHFTVFTTKNGLSNNHVRALYEDARGVLWVGTEMGLNRFQDGRFTIYTARRGFSNQPINQILEDDFTNLWISTERGIYQIKRAALDAVARGQTNHVQAVRYDHSDGLPSFGTNGGKSQPPGCKTPDGRLWFPTPKGLLVITPRRLSTVETPPPVVIEQVRADKVVVYGNRLRRHRQPALDSGAAQLRIAPGQGNVLEFDFNANSFIEPKACRYKYRLEGYEHQWIAAGTRRVAFYTHLPPGKYRFQVIACNHHHVWNRKGASLAFVLQPYYYQTGLFRGLLVLVIGALLVTLHLWRKTHSRWKGNLLRQVALVEERIRIAKDIHDGMGMIITQLCLLTALAERELPQREAAEARLRQIGDLAREASESLRDIVWMANPGSDTLESVVSRVCAQAEQLFRPQGIDCRFEVPSLPAFRLEPAVVQGLYLAAKEALNNISKHAQATEVTIRAAWVDPNFELRIEDDGRGLPTTNNGPVKSTSATSESLSSGGFGRQQPTTGLGLRSMRQRLENVGGTFRLETRNRGGTLIRFSLRLDRSQSISPTEVDCAAT